MRKKTEIGIKHKILEKERRAGRIRNKCSMAQERNTPCCGEEARTQTEDKVLLFTKDCTVKSRPAGCLSLLSPRCNLSRNSVLRFLWVEESQGSQ